MPVRLLMNCTVVIVVGVRYNRDGNNSFFELVEMRLIQGDKKRSWCY